MNSNNLVDWHQICVKYMYSALEVSRYIESIQCSSPGNESVRARADLHAL